MRVVIDAVGIRGHGGAAVLTELLHWLPIVRPEWHWHVFLLARQFREFDDPLVDKNVTLEHTTLGNSGIGRLLWVNHILPTRIKCLKADILFSFANIAPSHSPAVPQVVFCHQMLAFSGGRIRYNKLLEQLRLKFMRSQILRGARASNSVIVQTETMRKQILNIEPKLRKRIHVIPSGYKTPSEDPHIRSEKKALIDSTERPRLIYVAHPSKHKNHLALVRAMPIILKDFPSANLLLTLEERKSPNRYYSSFVDKILMQAYDLGISERLIWLGILNPDEVDYALRASDLMVFPSLSESFGLGLVESMAAGCPVAAADLPYAHEVCGNAAAYFNPNNSKSIADKVLMVCQNKNLIKQLKDNANRGKVKFSYQSIAEKTAKILEMALQLPLKQWR